MGTQSLIFPETTSGLADLLVHTGREAEARELIEDFSRNYPGKLPDLKKINHAWTFEGTLPTTRP